MLVFDIQAAHKGRLVSNLVGVFVVVFVAVLMHILVLVLVLSVTLDPGMKNVKQKYFFENRFAYRWLRYRYVGLLVKYLKKTADMVSTPGPDPTDEMPAELHTDDVTKCGDAV
jgi:hypothetical protein